MKEMRNKLAKLKQFNDMLTLQQISFLLRNIQFYTQLKIKRATVCFSLFISFSFYLRQANRHKRPLIVYNIAGVINANYMRVQNKHTLIMKTA